MNTKTQLKNEIKRLAEEGRRTRKEKIHPSREWDRYYAWDEKRAIGHEARLHLLAYACLRGVPYRVVEKKCREDEDSGARGRLIRQIHRVLLVVLPKDEHEAWTEVRIEEWLGTPAPVAQEAA